jgi:hypothetical protein
MKMFSFLKAEDSRKRNEREYLNNAKSLADLEYRMRQVDKGVFKQPYNFI